MPCVIAEHLEDALAAWELSFLETELVARGQLAGQGMDPYGELPVELTEWRNFRRTLLNNGIEALGPKAFVVDQQIVYDPGLVVDRHPGLTQLQTLPFELFGWTRKSRRVFRLNPWLQHVLEHADFPNMHWRDVLWPFEAFAVELAEPISWYSADLERDIHYDSVLVSRASLDNAGRNAYVVIRLFSNAEPKPINAAGRNKEEQRELQSLISQKRQWNRVVRIAERGRRRMHVKADFPDTQGVAMFPIFRPGIEEGKPIKLDAETLFEYGKQWYDPNKKVDIQYTSPYMEVLSRIAKIAVGLCLYLESVSGEGPEELSWEKHRAKAGPLGAIGVITDEAYICRVINQGFMDPTAAMQKPKRPITGGFKRPHWRRAHRRRPPHSDRNAPKSVKVPPRLINLHLVPLYGIIGGTKTEIKSEE